MTSKSRVNELANRSHSMDRMLIGDARQLRLLCNRHGAFADTIITSPPYGDLIDYRVRGQLGYGQTWDSYLADLTAVFRDCYALAKDTGSLWVVVDAWREKNNYRLLPLEIASRGVDIGWKLRDIIIWDKQHTIPYYQHGQLRSVYEYILFFTKTDVYKFYLDRIRDTDNLSSWWIDFPERFNPQGKSPTNIWHFPLRPQGAWRGRRENWRHGCPFPTELVARIIELTTDLGDVVFDPFAGSGVVLATAAAMGRHYLGIELNKGYVHQFESTVKADVAQEWNSVSSKRHQRTRINGSFGATILRLRALKYARKVTAAIGAETDRFNKRTADKLHIRCCVCITDIPRAFEKGDVLNVALYYHFSGPARHFAKVKRSVAKHLELPPLNNYRVSATVCGYNRKASLLNALDEYRRLFLYTRAKPRGYDESGPPDRWFGDDSLLPEGNVIPILSNLKVDVRWMVDSYTR